MMEGEYWWLGWQEIQRIQLAGTGRKLRDLVWRPVMLSLRGGGVRQAFVPARYPGTEATSEPSVLMGRETVFRRFESGELGEGTRILRCMFDEGRLPSDVPLTTFQTLEFASQGP
jgi:type VI secretion system protein ImpE